MLKITAYCNRVSVFPGETLDFMVNCEEPSYHARVVRIVHGDTHPAGPGAKLIPIDASIEGSYPGRKQAIHAGSFGIVEDCAAFSALMQLSVSAIIQPTLVAKGKQGIVTKWSEVSRSGFALFIDDTGCLAFTAGDGQGLVRQCSLPTPLKDKHWYRVSASIDEEGSLMLAQTPLDTALAEKEITTTQSGQQLTELSCLGVPLVFAGFFSQWDRLRPIAKFHFNGKIEAPKIYSRGTPSSDPSEHLIGHWDFSKGIRETSLADVSGHHLDGRVVNMPTRGVVGHFRPLDLHDWKQAPEYWGAIHFHDDDIHDAGWEIDFSWQVPEDLRSGIYGVELSLGEQTQFVVFVVRAAPGQRRTKLLYLYPLATYIAYANEHFGTNSALVELHLNRATVLHPHQVFLNEHREYGHSMYDLHSDGSGVYYSSRLRPLLNMQPFIESNHGAGPSYLWQFNADTHITNWLEASSIEFDVATDEDLHREGIGLLSQYTAVMTSTHPEYYSAAMWDGLYGFTQSGGRLIYMGGNGFYWRVAFHDSEDGIMEVRRAEGGSRAWEPPTGEYFHSFTGEYGGMWRRQGNRAPNVICGVGFVAQGFDLSTYYVRAPSSFEARARFVFQGIGKDEKIGDFGLIGEGASGMEVDAANRDLGTPAHALVLATSARHTEAHLLVVEEMLFNFMGTTGNVCPQVRSDMVFYETPGGGAVFSVGSIAWAGALSHNNYGNNVSRIMANVVSRFTDSTPFLLPE